MIQKYTFADKSKWSSGPWQCEPDRIVWTDKYTGLDCIVNRNLTLGFLCGYVGINSRHPLYGNGYESLNLGDRVDFAGIPMQASKYRAGLHDIESRHWFGFSCWYDIDVIPHEFIVYSEDNSAYMGIDDVMAECEVLAVEIQQWTRN